jgi:hypothetical protein
MENQKFGIQKIKEVLKFAFSFGEAFDKSFADKKFTWEDSANFLPVFINAGDAFTDVKNIIQEIKDLDSAEIDELNLFIKKEFDLENDAIEGFIESGIELAFNIYNLVFKVIRHKKDKNLPPQVD